jgi:hypothetical protein
MTVRLDVEPVMTVEPQPWMAKADLSFHYFRSPPVDGRSLTLATTTERIGRRMATVSATMTDHGGTDYVRAVANIAYERARAF